MIGMWKNIQILMKRKKMILLFLVWFGLYFIWVRLWERELSFRDCVCGGAGNPAASQLPASFSPPPDRNYQKLLDKKVNPPKLSVIISYCTFWLIEKVLLRQNKSADSRTLSAIFKHSRSKLFGNPEIIWHFHRQQINQTRQTKTILGKINNA